MTYLLHIDTSVISASVCLSLEEEIIGFLENPLQKDSASWIHMGIRQLLNEAGISLREVSAVSVSSGPGSYTGLRVGMATAKGICFALNKPLITINTLKMMAVAALNNKTSLVSPMIDARRMEVFTAVYDKNLAEIIPPCNIILEENSFIETLKDKKVIFFGNGSKKFQFLTKSPNAFFQEVQTNAKQLVSLAFTAYQENFFADLAQSEPFYGKTFYSPGNESPIYKNKI